MSITSEDANKICAIIDAQGYFIDKKFYPREIAVFNDDIQLCVEIPQNMPILTRIKNYKTILFQEYHIHGIPMERVTTKGNTSSECENFSVKNILYHLYNKVKREGKIYLASKNQQLAVLLKECEILFIDLEQSAIENEPCPSLCAFDKLCGRPKSYCSIHASVYKKHQRTRCALRKSENIWRWVQSKLQETQFWLGIREYCVAKHIYGCNHTIG